MSDFDEFAEELNELSEKAQELDGENSVPLGDLFNDEFMRQYTEFESIEEFFDESSWEVETQEDLEAIPDEEADEFVSEHTDFETADDMMAKAGKLWTKDQLGL